MKSTFKEQQTGDLFSTHGDYLDSMMYCRVWLAIWTRVRGSKARARWHGCV